MTSFDVNPTDLLALARSLSGLLANLQTAAAGMVSAEAGAAANAELDGAIEAFTAEWSAGLRESQEKLQALSSRLGDAGVRYESVDASVASAIEPPVTPAL